MHSVSAYSARTCANVGACSSLSALPSAEADVRSTIIGASHALAAVACLRLHTSASSVAVAAASPGADVAGRRGAHTACAMAAVLDPSIRDRGVGRGERASRSRSESLRSRKAQRDSPHGAVGSGRRLGRVQWPFDGRSCADVAAHAHGRIRRLVFALGLAIGTRSRRIDALHVAQHLASMLYQHVASTCCCIVQRAATQYDSACADGRSRRCTLHAGQIAVRTISHSGI